jgi:hypothetical protein
MDKMFMGKDNQTYDIGRILWFMGGVTFLVLQIYSVLISGVFDSSTFGTSLGAILIGGGAGIAVKHHTEPDAN